MIKQALHSAVGRRNANNSMLPPVICSPQPVPVTGEQSAFHGLHKTCWSLVDGCHVHPLSSPSISQKIVSLGLSRVVLARVRGRNKALLPRKLQCAACCPWAACDL